MPHDNTSRLTKLGSERTEYADRGVNSTMLEVFDNQFPERDYTIVHQTKEFTSLCPKTGQPDFGTIEIVYCPNLKCIESKSLKLYLFAWRSEGTFMETIVNTILNDLTLTCNPRWMTVIGTFASRGGITTRVIAEHNVPESKE